MSGADVARLLPGEPVTCTCTRMVVGTVEETMSCPAGWYAVEGVGWVHVLAAATPGSPGECEYAHAFAASLADTLKCPHPWREQPDGTWAHSPRRAR